MFYQHQIEYHNALKAAKVAYYSAIISGDISNLRVLFRTINNLIKPPSNINCSTTEQCNEFLNCFSSKIENIYSVITCDDASELELDPPNFSGVVFQVSMLFDYISKLVLSINSNTFILDPLPTTVLKNCLPVIVPHITAIVSASLNAGTVSPYLKMAAVMPVIKSLGKILLISLITDQFQTYHPYQKSFSMLLLASSKPIFIQIYNYNLVLCIF